MPRRPHRVSNLVVGALLSLLIAAPVATTTATAVVTPALAVGPDYTPPVEAPVVDPFRPPAHPYGPGNRGIEYRTRPGTLVRAAADGLVTFAGRVAGSAHVTVEHADGVRTSYSYLVEVRVIQGQRVNRRATVGVAGRLLHVGARRGDAYIDPAGLWGAMERRRVHLIPLDGRRRSTVPPFSHLGRLALAGSQSGSATIITRSGLRWASPTTTRAHLRSPTLRAVRGPGFVEPKERSQR